MLKLASLLAVLVLAGLCLLFLGLLPVFFTALVLLLLSALPLVLAVLVILATAGLEPPAVPVESPRPGKLTRLQR
jgi:hypothetical protein